MYYYLLALVLVLVGCSADYDTFGESDYNKMDDIGFVGQDGSAMVYADEHRIKVTLEERGEDEDPWESVTIDFIDMSHFATFHLVRGEMDEFPSDSAALDSLAKKVTYSSTALSKGDRIGIPDDQVVYVVILSESGNPSLWKIEFVIPGAEPKSSSSKAKSSSSAKETSSSSEKDKSSSSTTKSSDSTDKSSSSKDGSSSSSGEEPESSSSAEEPGEMPEILSLKIAGVAAELDSFDVDGKMMYHWHVDSLGFRVDLSDLEVTELEITEGAECDIELNETYDFSGNKEVTVSLGKAKRTYTVKAGYQLPGSDFDTWKSDDPQPDSIWNNANTVLTTTTKYSSNGVIGAKMATNELLGKVASGSLYTADFNPNNVGTLSMASSSTWPDGNELINFGRKFAARPEYVEFAFSYEGLGDSCDLYILLENRTGDRNVDRKASDVNTLVASAWFRSTTGDNTGRENPDVVDVSEARDGGFRTVRLKLKYGEPLEGSPIENSSVFAEGLRSKNKSAINNALVQGDGSETVTHVRVVMASSAAGNFYVGKKGATLVVDWMRLIY